MSTAALASTSARTRARRPSRAAAVGRRARRRGVVRAIAAAADDAEEEDAVNSSAAAPAEKEEAVVAWVVRAATRDDLDALVATAALSGVSWTASQIEDELENAVARVLVASAPEEDDDLADDADVPRASSSSSSSSSSFAGLAVAWSVAGETQILEVATAPSRRRRGVATALVRAALDLNPTGEAFLEVRASNDAALALYAALGFARVGARTAYYANPVEDAVLMRRAPPVVSARELTRLMAGLSPAEARKPPPTARGEEEARDPWTPHPQDLPRDRPAFVRRDSGAEGGGGGGGGFKFRSRISKR